MGSGLGRLWGFFWRLSNFCLFFLPDVIVFFAIYFAVFFPFFFFIFFHVFASNALSMQLGVNLVTQFVRKPG